MFGDLVCIGAAAARLFADEGANLVLAARGREGLESVAADIGGDPAAI